MTSAPTPSPVRVAIATRIFAPEPSAATFRLRALAAEFAGGGDDVVVLTVRPPAPLRDRPHLEDYAVRRFPVLRDRTGYVRGYLPYLSFDVPVFFRILFGRRNDLIVVEPPPTTGFFVRLAAFLRRTPYAYYAADIWSDAASQTSAPGWMIALVRAIERFALRGAEVVLSVSEGVTTRLAELGVSALTIGNGIDVTAFSDVGAAAGGSGVDFVYAGTASEWHGADVFLEAMPEVLRVVPQARLRYIGGGSERAGLEHRARTLGIEHAVSFEALRPPQELAADLRRACAAVASVRPGSGYDFAFPTKLYSAAACGVPLIYSGIGPAAEFVATEVDGRALGRAVGADAGEAAAAMIAAASEPFDPVRRDAVARWAAQHVSLDAVAARAVAVLRNRSEMGAR